MSYTDDQHKEWESYKTKFEKSYEGQDEEQQRKATYFENVKTMEEHNQKFEKGEVTWSMGINQFSDLTKEEFKNRHTGGCIVPQNLQKPE